ncbi:hypothetical protein PVAG01_02845 [Phlyctema vagabunda]|uniref:Phytanoyl-CoA dioxygenase n=1 Tax=Phlyctema vagabunda TaxID=108571 RepID=A0ABR4PS14_9HELO
MQVKIPTPAQPLDSDYVPKASITKLPATAAIDEILQVLDRDGGLILTDFVTTSQLDSINMETKKHYEGQQKHTVAIVPQETVLLGGLVGKSPTVTKICESDLLTQLREKILVENFEVAQEDWRREFRVDPLLSISLTFNIGHGAPRQRLHRDDQIWGTTHDGNFILEKERQFACLIAGVDCERANGATMFVPGSHRWADGREPKLDEICFAEMTKGSALIFLASAYHGGGHNSVVGSTRTVHGLFFCRGFLRTEENQFLAIPRSVALGMSNEMLTLLGYKKPESTLGIVENQDPNTDLMGFIAKANN